MSPWVEITQARIDTFAKAIEDFQWIHVDPARAKESPFGATIAHGFLTLSLLSHLSERTFSFADRRMGVNYGLNRVRFTSPVPSGSRVRARFTLAKYERLEGDGMNSFRRAEAISDRLLETRYPFEWLRAGSYSVDARLRQIQAHSDRVLAQLRSGEPREQVLGEVNLLRRTVLELRRDLAQGGGPAPPPLERLLAGRDTLNLLSGEGPGGE